MDYAPCRKAVPCAGWGCYTTPSRSKACASAHVHRIGDPIGGVFGALLPVAHRDADAGHLDHGQIIVAVADRHRVGERHAHGGRSETQSLALAARHQVAERNAIPPRLLARGRCRSAPDGRCCAARIARMADCGMRWSLPTSVPSMSRNSMRVMVTLLRIGR